MDMFVERDLVRFKDDKRAKQYGIGTVSKVTSDLIPGFHYFIRFNDGTLKWMPKKAAEEQLEMIGRKN